MSSLLFVFFECFVIFLFLFNRSYSIESDSLNTNNDPQCSNLFKKNADNKEIENAERWSFSRKDTPRDDYLSKIIKRNCDDFLKARNYFSRTSQNNEDEKNFPIAFTIVAFQRASQLERLLRMIYRPWNYYCIYVDDQLEKGVLRVIERLVKCINGKYNNNNAIYTKNRVNDELKYSKLTADLNCMRELYKRYKDWKYLINLTGQEFPLKTNAELVKILKAYKGANNIYGTFKLKNRTPQVKVPFGINWYSGSSHITVNRDFVQFIFASPKAKFLLDALSNNFPEEHFFATLNYNAQLRIPGSFIGIPDFHLPTDRSFFLTKYKVENSSKCMSKKINDETCILGVRDLPFLYDAPHLFANKFHEDFQSATLYCLEKWYREKVKQEILLGKVNVSETFYSSQPFVIYRYITPIDKF